MPDNNQTEEYIDAVSPRPQTPPPTAPTGGNNAWQVRQQSLQNGRDRAAAASAAAASAPQPNDPAPNTANNINDSELYEVNEATDTVKGQLENNFTNFDTPLMKRIAQQGRDNAQSRGLTNSTIASQGAIGNALDKAGEWATTDAGIYNNRKTTNVQAATTKYGTDQQRASALETTKIDAKARVDAASISAGAQMGAASIAANASMSNAKLQFKSNELDRVHEAEMSQVKFQRDKVMANMGYSHENYQNSMKNDLEANKFNAGSVNNAWESFNVGVANIDINATPESQRNQFDRLENLRTARVAANSTIRTAIVAQPRYT